MAGRGTFGRRVLGVALAVTLATGASAVAQSLDPASMEALRATLGLLHDPAQRGATNSPEAAAADRQAQALAGSPELTQELYGLAAEIFNDLTRSSGGDVGKMMDVLARGRSDPAGFAAFLSPTTLARLRELATKISDRRR
ncbi:MAG TPA: hypothetical protein VML54_05240 [Candidatus Limnocylindrales bacterium]|nr:hypothetical protein [Candidatus Limnocylindrales bacterium]